MTGAIHHYRRTLRMQPDQFEVLDYLHVPACHLKFDVVPKKYKEKHGEALPDPDVSKFWE